MAIRLQKFTGALPVVDKQLLPEGVAQVAENVFLTSGRLDPMYSPLALATVRSGTVKSVYRMYDSSADYWLNWNEQVDVVRSPVSGDDTFRIFFTSDEFEPRQTNLALATANTPYPDSWYVLGVTPPTTKPTVIPSGGVGAAESRVYCYTFVTQWGEESAPSPVSDITNGKIDDTWALSSMDTAPPNTYAITAASWAAGVLTLTVDTTFGLRAKEAITLSGLAPASLNTASRVASASGTTVTVALAADPGVITDQIGTITRDAPHNTTSMTKRIYRSVTDASGATSFFFVAEIAVATTTYNDTVTLVGEPLPSSTWLMPPADMHGLRVLPSGAVCGFSGNTVYISEPLIPYGYPLAYKLSVDYPIVGIGVFGNSIVVCTEGAPYIATGVDPATITLDRLEQGWPCLTKRGIAEFAESVFYPSNLGLIVVNAMGAAVSSEKFFSQVQWSALNPESFVASHYDGDYYTKVVLDNEEYVLVVSVSRGISRLTLQPDTLYNDPGTGQLYFTKDERVRELNAELGQASVMSFTTREYILSSPTTYSAAKIDADFNDTLSAEIAAYNAGVQSSNATVFATGDLKGFLNGSATNTFDVNGSLLSSLNTSAPSVTFTLYVNGEIFYSRIVDSGAMFRLPMGKKYDKFYVNISGNTPVRSVVLGETPDSLRTV